MSSAAPVSHPSSSSGLLKQTLRMVAVLVVACVVFVGTLSAAAVAMTSRAFAPPAASAAEDTSKAAAKADPTVPAKKPQSI